MKHFYHIRCDPELGEGYLVLVLGMLSNSPNPGYLTWEKPNNHVMLSNQKHVSTLQSYGAIINGILSN